MADGTLFPDLPAPGFDIDGDELIVDLFAGGGGASCGIEMALGRSPDIAVNHDADAIRMHATNHPATLHLQRNVWHVDPLDHVRNRRVGLLWASPDCKHHSKAKGGKPLKRNIRDLAWVVVHWAKRARPRVIFLENVEEFRDWGPLTAENRPCPARKGQTFQQWLGELKRLGYKVEYRELRACDYGAPTIRKRLFLIARRDGKPIVWPEPTHGAPDSAEVKAGKRLPWRTAAEIIDWSRPCPSIFLTKEEGRAVGCNRPLAENTMARIARGVQRYVIDAAKPFVVPAFTMPLTHHGGDRTRDLAEPLPTVTCANRGEHALVAPIISYAQQGGGNRSATDPMHTICASTKDQNTLVSAVLAGCGGRMGQSPPKPLYAPANTVTSKADQVVAAVHLQRQFGASVGHGADVPTGTVTAGGGGKTAVVAAHITKFRSGATGAPADEPLATVTANSFEKRPGGAAPLGVVAATMAQIGYGEREGQQPRAIDIQKPLGTVVGTGKHGLVAAFLNQHNTGVVGHSAEEPVSTISATGSQQTITAAHMLSLKGSDRRARSAEAPAATVTAQGWHIAEVRAFMIKYYGAGVGQEAGEPLHTVTVQDRFGLVTVEGEAYEIVDIGMRMLTPRELFRAQGFPDRYQIERDYAGKPFTGTVAVRCCGNSVCPPMAAALVAANVPDLALLRAAA